MTRSSLDKMSKRSLSGSFASSLMKAISRSNISVRWRNRSGDGAVPSDSHGSLSHRMIDPSSEVLAGELDRERLRGGGLSARAVLGPATDVGLEDEAVSPGAGRGNAERRCAERSERKACAS